jgi:hypothetical protein
LVANNFAALFDWQPRHFIAELAGHCELLKTNYYTLAHTHHREGNVAAIQTTRSEQRALDELVGRAILDKKVEQNLLKQETRRSLLDEYVLSRKVRQHLMSFNDMLDVADFAGVLYKAIYQ